MSKLQSLYARLSNEDIKKLIQDSSKSIEHQISYIKSYAKAMGIEISSQYIDDGYTGINFDRPDFKRLIEDIEKGIIDTVIVKDLSRLGRNFIETAYYVSEYFPDHNIRFISIDDDYDSFSSDADEKNMAISYKSVHNDNFIKITSQKIKETKKIKSNEKNYIGFIAPYGYKNAIIDGKRTLEVDEYAASIVKRIFEEIASGKTRREVADDLNKDKVEPPIVYLKMTPSNGKKYYYDWSAGAIYRMLKNVVYTGNLYYRKSLKENFRDKKRTYIWIRDREIICNTHKPIINEELYNKANNQLKETRRRCENNYQGYYGNLVYCGECGRRMTVMSKERTTGNIKYHFGCTRVYDRKKCPSRTISDSKLNNIVSDIIKKIISEYVSENEVVDQAIKDMVNKKSTNDSIEKLKLSIEASNIKIKNLYLKKTEGSISVEEFAKLKNEETIFKEQNEKQLLIIQNESKEFLKKDEMIKKYQQFIQDEKEFGTIVNGIINRIYIYKDGNIKINFNIGKIDSETIHLY